MDGMEMVYVPGGEFEMGSDDWGRDEQPPHSVSLGSFLLDLTEVTNAQYELCVRDGPCHEPQRRSSYGRRAYYGRSKYDDYPVILVTWHNSRRYCEWAGGRLPTEAEWEYAARGSEGNLFPWGNVAPDCTRANYAVEGGGCVGDTAPVGSYPSGASWCGALDLGGNVWEWVSDYYAEYPEEAQVNPAGPEAGRYRGMRGGSWFNGVSSMRGANRDRDPADSYFTAVGFRCAMDVP
jgi:serine/threonine-protein kinase